MKTMWMDCGFGGGKRHKGKVARVGVKVEVPPDGPLNRAQRRAAIKRGVLGGMGEVGSSRAPGLKCGNVPYTEAEIERSQDRLERLFGFKGEDNNG